jgi:3-hydroxybutyryl-CoA dehydrogenase
MSDGIKDTGVVGLGVMGFDIAFLYAMKGYRTLVYDASKAVMESLAARTEQTIERLKRRNRISAAEIENARQRLVRAAGLETIAEATLVTEAVSEAKPVKLAVYRALRDSGFAGILTTNTSSLTQTSLRAGRAFEPGKFATTHFFNPVLYTEMVEVVRCQLEEVSFDRIISFLQGLGRKPVETRDISGFVSNSVLMYYAVMALHLLQSGAKIDAVDQAAKQLGLLPPFISFDSWKPSIVEDVTRVMFELRGDRFLRSSKILRLLAEKNPLFYVDRKPNRAIYELIGATGDLSDATIPIALTTTIRLAAVRTVELGESPSTVDFVSVEGLKIPQAPLQEIDRLGADALLEDLRKINEAMPERKLPVPLLLSAMAGERQTFYKNGEVNPWLISFRESHAGH